MLDTLGVKVVDIHPPVELATTVHMDNSSAARSGAGHAGPALLAVEAEQVLALSDPLLEPHDAAADEEDVWDPNKAVFVEPDLRRVGVLPRCLRRFNRILEIVRPLSLLPRRLLCASFQAL